MSAALEIAAGLGVGFGGGVLLGYLLGYVAPAPETYQAHCPYCGTDTTIEGPGISGSYVTCPDCDMTYLDHGAI